MIFLLLFADIIALEHAPAWPRFHNPDIPNAGKIRSLRSAQNPELVIPQRVRCVTVFAFLMCEFVALKATPGLCLRLCKTVQPEQVSGCHSEHGARWPRNPFFCASACSDFLFCGEDVT